MTDRTLNDVFRRACTTFPDHVVIRNPGPVPCEPAEVTYEELRALVDRTAAGLASLGVGKGDRVALISRPRIRFAAATFAALRLGAWVMPLDPSLTREELAALFAHAEPKAALGEGDVGLRIPEETCPYIDLDDARGRTFGSLLGEGPLPDVVVEASDTAFLAYTSGTTGDPKGVMLSHGNVVADLANGTQVIAMLADDVLLSIAPWHHILGLVACLVLPIYGGATAMYTDDYRRIAELMVEHRVSIFVGVPKLYHALYERLRAKAQGTLAGRALWRVAPRMVGRRVKQRLTGGRLRFFVSGSAPLDPRVALGFRRLGIGMMEGYGLTETSPVVSLCLPFGKKAGSVGRPIPGVEARVDRPGADGVGELVLRGPIVMQGYYKNAAATARAIDPDGWFHTGDLAALDEEGEIFLKGRVKNVIVLDTGKNVYPEEIEWELGRIPYVEEVLVRAGNAGVEAVVFPNRERLAADGLLERVREAIWESIRRAQTRLAPYKRLRSIAQLILVDRPFPKTSTLDIKRHLLRDDAES
ncbi:MAG: AMP-binding protein [Candidatus Bipolaricaulota bacterium]